MLVVNFVNFIALDSACVVVADQVQESENWLKADGPIENRDDPKDPMINLQNCHLWPGAPPGSQFKLIDKGGPELAQFSALTAIEIPESVAAIAGIQAGARCVHASFFE